MRIDDSTIVVTGGAGLIGSTTVDQLRRLHAPRRIVIFDDFSRGTRANLANAIGNAFSRSNKLSPCDASREIHMLRWSWNRSCKVRRA